MSVAIRSDSEYVVPTYRAATEPSWHHFLHGNVPGHQIDFIYSPEVPQGKLTQQHFSHLARLIKYIEPRPGAGFAFAVGNLSRDDTQHEPGHGGIGLILGLRVRGATDHAGRRDPPFAHGIAGVDREFSAPLLLRSAVSFYHRLLGEPGHEGSGALSRMYSRFAAGGPSSRLEALRSYIGSFADLPELRPSGLSLKWTSRGPPPQKRVVIVHEDDAPFELLAGCAARIASVLYRSDLRWTSITTGREGEIPNGVSIRLVPMQDRGGCEGDSLVLLLDQVPEGEPEIATRLFALSSTEATQTSGSPGRLKLEPERPREALPKGNGQSGASAAECSGRGIAEGTLRDADASIFMVGSAGGPAWSTEHARERHVCEGTIELAPRSRPSGDAAGRTSGRRAVWIGLGIGAALLIPSIVWMVSAGFVEERGAGATDEAAAQGRRPPANLPEEPRSGQEQPNAKGQSDGIEPAKRPPEGEGAGDREPAVGPAHQGDVDSGSITSPSNAPEQPPRAQLTRPSTSPGRQPFGGKKPVWQRKH